MKSRLAYLAFRLLSAGFSRLPESWARAIGLALGRAAYRFAGEKRRMARRHMARVLGPDADLDAAARGLFADYGRYWAEVFWVTPERRAEISANCAVEGMEYWVPVKEAGTGAIFALPHIGNWELGGTRSEDEGARVLAVAEALPNRQIVDWFIETRYQLGIDIVIAERGTQVTRALQNRLAAGGVIGLMSDRDLSGRGIEVEFFGEKTTLPAGPAALADRMAVPIFPIAAYFKEGRGHILWVDEPIVIADLPTRDERLLDATQRLAKAFEVLIRRHPTQWHLLVPNWPSDHEDPAPDRDGVAS